MEMGLISGAISIPAGLIQADKKMRFNSQARVRRMHTQARADTHKSIQTSFYCITLPAAYKLHYLNC